MSGQHSNNISIIIKNNVGDSIGICKHYDTFLRNNNIINIIKNVDFIYSFTHTTSAQPNVGNVTIFGLDREIKDLIYSIGDKVEYQLKDIDGQPIKGKALMTWIPYEKDKDGFIGSYEYKVPEIDIVINTNGDKLKPEEKKPIFWHYKEIGWSKIEIYAGDLQLYVGDITKITDDIDSIVIDAGTQHYFYQMLFSERVMMSDDSEIIYYNVLKNADMNSVNLIQWKPENYAKIFEKIVNNWINDDPYEDAQYKNILKGYDLNTVAKKAFEKYNTKKDLKDLELSWDVIQFKRLAPEKKKENGEKLKTNEYYTLSGKISDIFTDIADKGFLNIMCYNDIFYLNNYWVTQNPLDEIMLESYVSVGEGFNHFPIGNLIVTEDGRGTFTSSLKLYLLPSTGVTIYRNPDEEDVDMYIDTVEVSGNQDTATVTYSGRTKDFLWLDEV